MIIPSNRLKRLLALTILTTITVVGQNHRVLIERSTATWCSPCIYGKVYGDSLEQYNSRIISVVIHHSDSLTFQRYADSSSFLGFPMARFNRSTTDQLHENWFTSADSMLNLPTEATLSVNQYFQTSGRQLQLSGGVQFVNSDSGNYRLVALLLEDGIYSHGQANGYTEEFDFGSHPYYSDWRQYIPAGNILHNRIVRELLTPFSGVKGIIPEYVKSDSTYLYSIAYNIPDHYDLSRVYALVLLVNHSNGKILDVEKTNYLNGLNNTAPIWLGSVKTQGEWYAPYDQILLARDPNLDALEFSILQAPDWLSIEQDGKGNGRLYGIAKDTGVFRIRLRVSDGTLADTLSFDLLVETGDGFYWENVGDNNGRPFYKKYTENNNLMNPSFFTDHLGKSYAYMVEENSNTHHFAYLKDNTQWTPMTSLFNQSSNYRTLPSEGKTFVLHKYYSNAFYDRVSVLEEGNLLAYTPDTSMLFTTSDWATGKKLMTVTHDSVFLLGKNNVVVSNGEKWKVVGQYIPDAHLLGLEVGINQKPYLMVQTKASKQIKFMNLVGNEWVDITAPISAETSGIKSKLRNRSLILICWREASSGLLKIHQWNGSEWKVLQNGFPQIDFDNYEIAIDSVNNPLLVLTNSKYNGGAFCYRYENNQWTPLGGGVISKRSARSPNIITMPDGSVQIGILEVGARGWVRILRYRKADRPSETKELFANGAVVIYPNPIVGGKLYLKNVEPSSSYTIYDLQGRLLKLGYSEDQSIDVGFLRKGRYLLSIGHNTYRFLIE